MRIELVKPHTHVGKLLRPGDTLELTEEIASWLIREGTAKAADLPISTEPPKTELPNHSKHSKEDKPK